MKTALLIPCRDEAATIQRVVDDWRRALPHASIFVYDNGSTDDTARLAAEAGATVRQEPRAGKGRCVRQMLRDIDADCYLLVDGDDTYGTERAADMERLILDGEADMVIGDRLSSTYFQANSRPFHGVGNRLVRAAINRLFRADVHDVMTGCRAFSRRFARTFPLLSDGFEIETEMTIFALDADLRLREIPVSYRDRGEGSTSKLRTVPDGLRVLRTIFTLFRDHRPLPFFGTLALLTGALGGGFLVPVVRDYWQTGLVPRFPTLIACSVTLLAALLFLFAGIILHVQVRHHRALMRILWLRG